MVEALAALQGVQHQVKEAIGTFNRDPAQLRGSEPGADQDPDRQIVLRLAGVAGGQDLAQLAGVEEGRPLLKHPRPAEVEAALVDVVALALAQRSALRRQHPAVSRFPE